MKFSKKNFSKLNDESKAKVEYLLDLIDKNIMDLTKDHVSLIDAFKTKTDAGKKTTVNEVVNFVNNLDGSGKAQSRVVSIKPVIGNRVLFFVNGAYPIEELRGISFVYDFDLGRIGLVYSAEGKNSTTTETSLRAHYFYKDPKTGGIKSSVDSDLFSINKTNTKTSKNMDFIGHFFSNLVKPTLEKLNLRGRRPFLKLPPPTPKPAVHVDATMLPLIVDRTDVSEKSLKNEYNKSNKQMQNFMYEHGDAKRGKPISYFRDPHMGIICVMGENGKMDFYLYRNPKGPTPPIEDILNGSSAETIKETYNETTAMFEGSPIWDSSKDLAENIAQLTPEQLNVHPYFAKIKKDSIKRKKGKGNEDYYEIQTYDTFDNKKKMERITVKDVSASKTLSTFFDATMGNKSYVDAFKKKAAWKDERIQRMAKILDEARSNGDPIKKVRELGRSILEKLAVFGMAAGLTGAAFLGGSTATGEVAETVNGKVVEQGAQQTTEQVLENNIDPDVIKEINPSIAQYKKAKSSSTNLLNYRKTNGKNEITGPSELSKALVGGENVNTLGFAPDKVVDIAKENESAVGLADASLFNLKGKYMPDIEKGVFGGYATILSKEANSVGAITTDEIIYVEGDEVNIAKFDNISAFNEYKEYLGNEIKVKNPEDVAKKYFDSFYDKSIEIEYDNTQAPTTPSTEENFEINDELKQFVGGLVGVDSADIVSISEKFPSTNGSSNRTVFAIAGDKLYEISYNSSENTTNTTGLILEMNNAYENGRMEINGYVKYSDVLQGIRTENDWKRIYNNMAKKLGTNVYGAYIPDPETHNQLSQNADGSYNVEMLVIGDNGDMENVVARVARTDGKAVTLTEAYNAALTIYGADPVSGYKVYNDVTTSTLENICPEASQDANLAQQNPNKVVAYKMSYYDPYDDMDKVGVYLKHENNKADNNQNSVNKTNPERTK